MVRANLRIDYKMALEMTYGILVLEIIHRVIVCIFEVSMLLIEILNDISITIFFSGILASTWCKWSYWWCNTWKIHDGIKSCSMS